MANAEEAHEEISNTIRNAILKKVSTVALRNYTYDPDRGVDLEVDLLVLLNYQLCLFEIKTGSKERKARKQLQMHKTCMINLQNKLSAKGLLFTEVKTFWVSWNKEKVVNTITNKEVHIADFLENPIPFLLE